MTKHRDTTSFYDYMLLYLKNHDIFWYHDFLNDFSHNFDSYENKNAALTYIFIKRLIKQNAINCCEIKGNHKQYMVISYDECVRIKNSLMK